MARSEAHRLQQKAWYEKVVKGRRKDWIEANGPCAKCGSWDRLEVDHIDPSTKVSHNVWGWSETRRLEELAKCQVLCYSCHKEKTRLYYLNLVNPRRKAGSEGTAWCGICKAFLPICQFTKNIRKWNGFDYHCASCRSLRRSPQ